MSKQRPNPDRLTNELAGASAFFKRPSPVPAEPPAVEPAQPEVTPPPTSPVDAPRTARTPVRPARRQMIRHPFELYMDQLDALRDLAEAQRRRGEPSSMSRMVREAIDRYLDEHPIED